MTLREKRCRFTELICTKLVPFMLADGVQVAVDEWTERLTKKDPTSDHGDASWHHVGLAVDINLYRDGKYLTQTADHEKYGRFWETLDAEATWGGDFNDGNHYSWGEH